MSSSKKNTCPSCRITNVFQEHLPTSCEIEENNSLSRPLPGKESNFMAVHTNECKRQNSLNNTSFVLQKCQQVSWTIADRLFCAFVCAPAVVVYWRGGWSMMDNMLLPERRELSAWISLFIGFIINCIFTLMQNQFAAIRRDSILFILFSRSYTAIFGLACINSWRGLWELLDLYAGKTVTSTSLTISGALLSLIILKGVRNITSTPMILATDNPKDYFKISTQYAFQCDVLAVKMGPRWGWWAKIADAFYGVVIIGSLVVVFWRGIWIFCDDFIYPHNLKHSGMVSLLIGYTLVGVTYLFEPVVYRGCHYLKGLLRLLLADIYAITASVGAISVWRGVWCIFDWTWMRYTDSIWPAWAAHIGAFFVLLVLYCSNTVLVRGLVRDGAEPGGECISLQCTYFTSNDDYYLKQREKSSEINSRALNIGSSFETVECYM